MSRVRPRLLFAILARCDMQPSTIDDLGAMTGLSDSTVKRYIRAARED